MCFATTLATRPHALRHVTLAMESIQIVLTPNNRPRIMTKSPGAAPVEIIAAGFSLTRTFNILKMLGTIRYKFLRLKSTMSKKLPETIFLHSVRVLI